MTEPTSRDPSRPPASAGRSESRPRLSADERRQQLLDVAGQLFAEHGYHGLSMEQLAEGAGVSKPVLYQHFPSKRDLYLGLLRDAIAEMEAQVTKALEDTGDNKARVHSAIGAYFDFIGDRRFALLFSTAELADPGVRAEIESANRRVADVVGSLIAEDAGLDLERARLLAVAVRALATEGARWWLESDGIDKDEAVRLLARLSWRGLGSFGPPKPEAGADDSG
jgi:AcrR family transcriptional regulator